jgi:hypothetical protein
VLVSQFNLSNPGKGIENLLNNGDNLLTLMKLTDAIMDGSMIKASKNQADEFLSTSGITILPATTS